MRCFRVMCMHGHCGAKQYRPITFVFYAENAIQAMDLAKEMPGVKHSKPIIECREITYSEYMEYRKKSAYERMETI